jgi:hypothetical protein
MNVTNINSTPPQGFDLLAELRALLARAEASAKGFRVAGPVLSEPAQALPQKVKAATAETRKWMLSKLAVYNPDDVKAFACSAAILLPTENLTDWPLRAVPVSNEGMANLIADIEEWIGKKNGEAQPEQSAPVISGDLPCVTGVVDRISKKEGTSPKGKKYTRYGIQIEGQWFNTFDSKIAEEAERNKGQRVTVQYEETSFGKEAKAIELPEVIP